MYGVGNEGFYITGGASRGVGISGPGFAIFCFLKKHFPSLYKK
jgi:hypothetical protein